MRTLNKFVLSLSAAVVLGIVLAWATSWHPSTTISSSTSDSGRIKVVASFYPVAEFARQVGGDLVSVSTITPSGTEPHDYEPTARQVAEMYGADLVLYNGGGVDAWADRIAPELKIQGVPAVEMGSAVDLLASSPGEDAPTDPHFWLDPALAEKEVAFIRDTLSTINAKNAATYARNADAYLAQLSSLDADFVAGLASCHQHTVVTSHAAFAYLAKHYGFDVISISGISPEQEPSAGRLSEIAAIAKAKGVRAIFFETLVSPKLSETIASEIGARTLVFNPLEGLSAEEASAGEDYLSVMRSNLENLKTGMVCP
ncbi:MAG: zinc ABC transporter substrate-binding protein [Candidatus Uhrbacteria bacterium]